MRTTSAIVALALMGCTAVSAGGIRANQQVDASGRSLGSGPKCVELDEATLPVAPDTEFAPLPQGFSGCNGNAKGSDLVKNMFYATQSSLKMRTVQPNEAEELAAQVCGQQLKFDLTCQNTPWGNNMPACVKLDIECDFPSKEEESYSSDDAPSCYETKPDEVVLGQPDSGEKKLAKVPGFQNCNIYDVKNNDLDSVENIFYFRDAQIWMRTLQSHQADEIRNKVCDKTVKFLASCQSTPEGENVNDPEVCFKMDVECREYDSGCGGGSGRC